VREPSGAPVPAGVLFPELLADSEPAPPAQPRGAKLVKVLARVLLWSLITVGAIRGLLPVSTGPAPSPSAPAGTAPATSAGPPGHRQAEAVAAAFLREYLTVGEDRAARAKRLSQLTARGVDLRWSLSLPADVAQYADLVVAAGSRSVAGGVEVAVVAHVLQVRDDVYADGGTLAFVVPMAVSRKGVAVSGRPRPTTVPVSTQLSLPRPPAVPPSMSRLAERAAHQAVVALVTSDKAALTRLGGGQAPSTRPLPSGWHVVSVSPAKLTGPVGEQPAQVAPGGAIGGQVNGTGTKLTAEVTVRARPPAGPASYSLPVRVQLETGSQGSIVRQIDGGGSP
jgi:hypothetical protein